MTDIRDNGGPAFPAPYDGHGGGPDGMSLRQYAAINLCVPDSGTPWLDDMIRQARRDRFAGQALAGILANPNHRIGDVTFERIGRDALTFADALISARKGNDDGR